MNEAEITNALNIILLGNKLSSEEQLQKELQKHPQHSAIIEELQELVTKKLYHQLTEKVLEYLKLIDLYDPQVVEIFQHIVLPLKDFMNLLKVMRILNLCVSCIGHNGALQVINSYNFDFQKSPDAEIYYETMKAYFLVSNGDYNEAENLLNDLQAKINLQSNIDPILRASFCRSSALLCQRKGDLFDYCKFANLYLSYTPLDEISEANRAQWAVEYCYAAIVCEKVFNFGELLQVPLIKEHGGNVETGWLIEFLQILSEGNIDAFNIFLAKHSEELHNLGYSKHVTTLREKITILALLEACFRMLSKRRILTFTEISQLCRIPEDEVELLVMKAMSCELIKGKIDEISRHVQIFWIMPKILDNSRLDIMRQRIDTWVKSAKELLVHLEAVTPELLIS